MGPEPQLTQAPSLDHNAHLFFTPGEDPWIVYENANAEAYNICQTNQRHLIVAQIADEGLLAPKSKSSSRPWRAVARRRPLLRDRHQSERTDAGLCIAWREDTQGRPLSAGHNAALFNPPY